MKTARGRKSKYSDDFKAEAVRLCRKDRKDNKLFTLEDFLNGKSDFVSVAMDKKAARYGTKMRIYTIDEKYADDPRYEKRLAELGVDHIPFKVVDTGSAFRKKGYGRLDICLSRNLNALDVFGRKAVEYSFV